MVGIWGRMALRVVSQCLSAVLECHQGALLPGSGCILFACAGEPGARMTMQICSHSPQGQLTTHRREKRQLRTQSLTPGQGALIAIAKAPVPSS